MASEILAKYLIDVNNTLGEISNKIGGSGSGSGTTGSAWTSTQINLLEVFKNRLKYTFDDLEFKTDSGEQYADSVITALEQLIASLRGEDAEEDDNTFSENALTTADGLVFTDSTGAEFLTT